VKSGHWKTITPSEFPWEREALEFIRERLPDGDPYRAWTNFEFMGQDGSINEVDLLVLSPVGFFLVEIKSWSGRVRGDAGTWEWTREGRTRIVDNPLLLTNRKAKKLRSLLEAQRSAVARITIPWIEPLVFLSAPDVQCELDYPIRESVFFRDRPPRGDKPGRRGIVAALHDLDPEARIDPRRARIDRNVARALTRAMESAGIRPSQKYRRVKDYELGDLLAEGTTFQD
jgi:nuclease-like protein